MHEFGKTLLVTGLLITAAGVFLVLFSRVPWIGKLPGDIIIRKKEFTFYAPLATSLILSVILSLVLWLWPRR